MKKSRLISYSIVLLTSALMFGCTTSDRVEEIAGIIANPQDQNQTPNSGGNINDENATIGTIKIDAKNSYKVSVSFSDSYNQKGYYSKDEIGQLNFNITNIYTNESADISIIEYITLEAEEKISETEGKYLNFITYTGEEGPTYSIPKESVKATDSVAVRMKGLSGTTNIILSVKIQDFDDPYELKIPLVIEKNRSSSMAIVPYETKYENGLFIDKFVIHAVDSYGNRAKDGTRISTGVINNPKLYSKAFNGRGFDDEVGTFEKNASAFTLPANSIDTNILQPTDTLITLANQNEYRPENLGGWDIIDLIPQESKLEIINHDKGENVSNMSYVIGNEYRYDPCHDTIMNPAASTFESTEVKNGVAYAELRYVPAMVGKTVFIYANTRLNDKHIGISRRVALTGLGLSPVTVSCTNDKGNNPTCSKTINFTQNGSGDFSRQSSIAYPINTGNAENAHIRLNRGGTDYQTDCSGNINITITNIDVNKTATYTLGTIATELITNQ